MAKPRFQYKCKICELLKTHQELWVQVHDRIILQGDKKSHVVEWLNQRMEVIAAGKKEKPIKFNITNFTTHFTKHIPDVDKMKIELHAALAENDSNLAFTEEERAIAEAAGTGLDENAEAFREYPGIIGNLEAAILNDLQNVGNILDSNSKLKVAEADRRLRLFTTLITGKQKVFEIQKLESVGGTAVKDAMMNVCHTVIDATQKTATEIREILLQQMPDSTFPSEVHKMIVDRTLETLKTNFAEIYGTILKKYGLKG